MAADSRNIPVELAWLNAAILSGLPDDEAWGWPDRFSIAIGCNSDLSLVWHRFAVWMLGCIDLGLSQSANRAGKSAIYKINMLYLRAIEGSNPSPEEWSVARSLAQSAIDSLARSAESQAAKSYVTPDTFSPLAALAAVIAAEAVASSCPAVLAAVLAAASASPAPNAYARMADKLIALIMDAPVVAH